MKCYAIPPKLPYYLSGLGYVAVLPPNNEISALVDMKRFEGALQLLWQAHAYQSDTGRSAWDFAVEMESLREQGLSHNDLRWLLCRGLVEHQREITPRGDNSRMFRETGTMMFTRRSCFTLTHAGVAFVEARLSGKFPVVYHAVSDQPQLSVPVWDGDRHELRVADQVVKRFKRPAVNQETILAAFEEDGWPARIDDPLPMAAEQDPKRRLHDTIKCLNRNQKIELLRFEGDGTGEGVLWGYTDSTTGVDRKPA